MTDNGKDKKKDSKNKCMEHDYHVQYRKYVQQKPVKYNVLQWNFKHCSFVVHMQKPMEWEGWIEIIICDLTLNKVMTNVK